MGDWERGAAVGVVIGVISGVIVAILYLDYIRNYFGG